MRSILVIFTFLFLFSCAKKPAEEVDEAVDVALTYLSSGKCAEAIKILESVGRQNGDAIYLQVLASAYACKASFSEINFIGTDLPNIDTSPTTDLYKSLSIMSLSNETTTDSEAYENLLTAMGIILNSGGGEQPSQQGREGVFGIRKAGDLGMQLLFLDIVQLGKFLNHFGNVNSSGVKGAGTTNTNSCFINYTYTTAQSIISTLPVANNCNSNTDGHPDLDLTTTAGKRRGCEGLMLVTNLIDVLNNIDVSGNDTLNDLSEVADLINEYKDVAIAADPNLETLLTTTSQSECETLLVSSNEVNNLQLIYAFIFETGLQ